MNVSQIERRKRAFEGRWLPAARVLGPLLGFGPLARIAERRIRKLPEGPTPKQRAGAKFAICAEADGARGTRRVWVTGPDGYDFTAASATWCAMEAAKPGFAGRGALTPSQAFGARRLLEAFAPIGVAFGD